MWGASKQPLMVRQVQIALLLVCVFLLGSDVQALACELSCAAEGHQSQRDSAQSHSHHHSSAILDSADVQSQVPPSKGSITFITDQHDLHSVPGCAAADRVTLSVPVIAQANTVSHLMAAVVEDNSRQRPLPSGRPAEFGSPPHIRSVSQHNPTPLRI